MCLVGVVLVLLLGGLLGRRILRCGMVVLLFRLLLCGGPGRVRLGGIFLLLCLVLVCMLGGSRLGEVFGLAWLGHVWVTVTILNDGFY